MARHYSPTAWKLKKHFNAEHIEYIGRSYYFSVSVYLVEVNGKYRFIMYDDEKQCTCKFKQEYDDNTEFDNLSKDDGVKIK